MTKITQADIKCWKAIFSFTDEQMDIDNDDKRGLELLAAHREAAFEAGREQAEREVEWLRAEARLCDCFAREAIATTTENKEHRNDD